MIKVNGSIKISRLLLTCVCVYLLQTRTQGGVHPLHPPTRLKEVLT